MSVSGEGINMSISIEQTMQASHVAVRERLGMGVRTVQAIPLRLVPPARTQPSKREIVTSDTVINVEASWRQIIKEAMEKHNVTMPDFMGSRRSRNYIRARREAAWRMLTERSMSYTAIAKRLGYKDHSSIINLIAGYEKENGGVRSNSKPVMDAQRKVRNEQILRQLNEGALLPDLAVEYSLSTTAIRAVGKSMGFDFFAGADWRASEKRRELANKKRAEAKIASDARKAKEARERRALVKEKAYVKALSEQYYSTSQASRAISMPESTLRGKAVRHGIVFRNNAKRAMK